MLSKVLNPFWRPGLAPLESCRKSSETKPERINPTTDTLSCQLLLGGRIGLGWKPKKKTSREDEQASRNRLLMLRVYSELHIITGFLRTASEQLSSLRLWSRVAGSVVFTFADESERTQKTFLLSCKTFTSTPSSKRIFHTIGGCGVWKETFPVCADKWHISITKAIFLFFSKGGKKRCWGKQIRPGMMPSNYRSVSSCSFPPLLPLSISLSSTPALPFSLLWVFWLESLKRTKQKGMKRFKPKE